MNPYVPKADRPVGDILSDLREGVVAFETNPDLQHNHFSRAITQIRENAQQGMEHFLIEIKERQLQARSAVTNSVTYDVHPRTGSPRLVKPLDLSYLQPQLGEYLDLVGRATKILESAKNPKKLRQWQRACDTLERCKSTLGNELGDTIKPVITIAQAVRERSASASKEIMR